MLHFLSKESINAHIEYMKDINHNISVITKSYPSLYGKSPADLMNMHLPKEVCREAEVLTISYLSHKCYFSSFAENDRPCPAIRKYFSSEDAFLYEVFDIAKKSGEGFIYIFSEDGKIPKISNSENTSLLYKKNIPKLALDLSEHAYFRDYGFKREEYIHSAVARLDIAKLFEKT